MTDPIPDEDLRALFARQRCADRERAPGFAALCIRKPGAAAVTTGWPPLAWRWAMPGAAALGLGLTLIFSLHHSAKVPLRSPGALELDLEQIDASLQESLAAQTALTAWQSPTDFLLTPTHHEDTP
jgi:hypothetical protein